MEPELEPMLPPPEPRAGTLAPLWVWVLVVVLGGVSVYAGYAALSSRQLYLEGERVRADLAQQRDRLKANAADLARQVDQANTSRAEVDNALKQSRANTEAASTQIADLQRQIADLQQQAGNLQQVREAADASAKEAAAAKATAEQLKTQLAAAQKKLNQALADLKKEREQFSPVPVGPPEAAAP